MEYRQCLRALGLGLLLLLLTSCNMWPVTHMKRYFHYISPEMRLARFQNFNYWRVEGVFSVQCYGLPHAKPFTVTRFSWKNFNKKNFTLRLESTYGDFDTTVMVEYNDVLIWRDFKYPFHIRRPEQYMQQELGWHLPMRSMAFWLRGMPAPVPFVAHYNEFGLIDVLQQQGWTIRYKTYTDLDGYDVPRSMTMIGQGVFISIVMNQWDTLLLNRSVEPL